MAAVAAAALAATATSAAAVRKIALTSPVAAGNYASLTVFVSPSARCTIKVVYDTVTSRAAGLGAKTGGRIIWRWRVGTNTHSGRWPITVTCGTSGTLRTWIVVHGT